MLALQDTLPSIDESNEITFDAVKDLIDKVNEGLATVRAEAVVAAKAEPSQPGSRTVSFNLPSPAPAASSAAGTRDGVQRSPLGASNTLSVATRPCTTELGAVSYTHLTLPTKA